MKTDNASDTGEAEWLAIESLDLEAQGVAHRADGKTVFIEGALPGEMARVRVMRRKAQWEQGVATEVACASPQRVQPGCPNFGLHAGACGGCKMQHLQPAAQVAVKQRALEDALWHLGRVKPQQMMRPLEGPAWHYRYRARLSVRHVVKKGAVLIGFHERKSGYVADMQVCPVLPEAVSAMLLPLRQLFISMDARDTCPQIELACGEAAGTSETVGLRPDVMALVLRHLAPLTEADLLRLQRFAEAHTGVQWWLQAKGPETACLMPRRTPAAAADEVPGSEVGLHGGALMYHLPEFGIRMPFWPTDFTQVNPQINRVLVARVMRWLDVQPGDRVIDWFCGLGNFTLPLATVAASVVGVEGSTALVTRARENYRLNQPANATRGVLAPTSFSARNLFEASAEMLRSDGVVERWLLDPPREGATSLVNALAELIETTQSAQSDWRPPSRIVYVSCNPATLARDADVLVHRAGYRCICAGIVNMFPHTAHVESIAVFERG